MCHPLRSGQAQSWPIAVQGSDLVAVAKTGVASEPLLAAHSCVASLLVVVYNP